MSRMLLYCLLLIASTPLLAQEPSDSMAQRPFVRGGVYDKPFMRTLFERTSVGGYIEAVWLLEREAGVTEEVTFDARRFNLFVHSMISDRARLFAEVEFEHGGEEIELEAATIDYEFHPAVILRGGVILSPLGKFNLAHDSPMNELTDRPMVSTRLIPTTLSEAGMGFFGGFYPTLASRVTYELYAVNGFNSGLLATGEGTRIRAGRSEAGEDNNHSPSVVGRVAYAHSETLEFGLSGHTGAYNEYSADGVDIDEKRNVSIGAFDWELTIGDVSLLGEAAVASIDVQPSLEGLFGQRQQGIYGQVNYRFATGLVKMLPLSYLMAIVRYDYTDFDADIQGDAAQRVTVGANFRATSDTVFKIDYHRDWFWSRVDVRGDGAGINFSLASYF